MLKKLLLSPAEFFRNKIGRKVDLKLPAIIIVLNSAIGAISGFFLLSKVDVKLSNVADLSYNADTFLLVGFIFGAFLSIALGIIIWLVQSFIFHIFASFQGGQGNYRKLVELVGYSQLPLIFSSVVAIAVIAGFAPELSMETVQNKAILEQTLLSIPAFKASRVFGRLMLFWSLYLSVIAVREVHGISTKKAAASVPVLILAVMLAALFFGVMLAIAVDV